MPSEPLTPQVARRICKHMNNDHPEALIQLVLVRKKSDSIQVVRKLPKEINKIFSLLEEGPRI